MSRVYAITFRGPNDEIVEVNGYGNTRRSAERSARSRLRRDHKVDPREWWTVTGRFVPESKR